jgi:hypothetical protein
MCLDIYLEGGVWVWDIWGDGGSGSFAGYDALGNDFLKGKMCNRMNIQRYQSSAALV